MYSLEPKVIKYAFIAKKLPLKPSVGMDACGKPYALTQRILAIATMLFLSYQKSLTCEARFYASNCF